MKFYESVTYAITDVVQELEAHTRHDYLRREFAAIITKIDAKWPHADRLKKLLDPNTSLGIVCLMRSVFRCSSRTIRTS